MQKFSSLQQLWKSLEPKTIKKKLKLILEIEDSKGLTQSLDKQEHLPSVSKTSLWAARTII